VLLGAPCVVLTGAPAMTGTSWWQTPYERSLWLCRGPREGLAVWLCRRRPEGLAQVVALTAQDAP
jgi:hypothetical protein